MCGASLSPALGLSRRTRSQLDLTKAVLGVEQQSAYPHATQALAVLKTAKSFSDSELPAGLNSLRLYDRDFSTQSGSDDTGRSSPTEHLLRSRSPCAVLHGSGVAVGTAAPPQDSRQSPCAPRFGLMHADTPFLESAAAFSVVDVPLAVGRAISPADLPAPTQPSAAFLAAAAAAAADPVVAAATASHAAYCSAQDSAASSPPSSALSTVPSSPQSAAPVQAAPLGGPCLPPRPTAPPLQPQVSPFARMAVADHPSAITPAPGLLTQSSGGLAACSRQSSLMMQQHPSLMGCGQSEVGSSAGSSPRSGSMGAEVALTRRASMDGWGNSSHLSEGHAAEELFYRLNHARQTVDFVKRQATSFSQLNKAAMGVWEALELLNTLREYETALLGVGDELAGAAASAEPPSPDMPLLEHALQCAEACRVAWPDEEYMHLAGLLAPLGKLLAHAKFGAEPQWAICGETFPVGCRFHPAVRHSQFFSANPDRRKRLYSSPSGVYREGCGLGSVLMSWGAGEYLHLVLRLNRVALPPEALFCIRHQKLRCVFRGGGPYGELLSEFDRVQLPRLAKFQQLCAYQRHPCAEPVLVPVPGAAVAGGEDVPMQVAPHLKRYYDSLMAKYMPHGVLMW